MNAPIQHVQAATIQAIDAILFAALSDGTGVVVDLSKMTVKDVEALLGGELEVVQLDAQTCLLTYAKAVAECQDKNMPASQRWFARHPESGYSEDFIRGNVILCQNSQIAHLNHLHAEVKPILTSKQRAERAASIRAFGGQENYEEAKLACSIANPEGCEMCGS